MTQGETSQLSQLLQQFVYIFAEDNKLLGFVSIKQAILD